MIPLQQEIEKVLNHAYSNARSRYLRVNWRQYKDYRGRGIKFLWPDFKTFKEDMFASYVEHARKYGRKNTTLDRIDNDGNYCKENCQWATRAEQRVNCRPRTHCWKGHEFAVVGVHLVKLKGVITHRRCLKCYVDYEEGRNMKYRELHGIVRTNPII